MARGVHYGLGEGAAPGKAKRDPRKAGDRVKPMLALRYETHLAPDAAPSPSLGRPGTLTAKKKTMNTVSWHYEELRPDPWR